MGTVLGVNQQCSENHGKEKGRMRKMHHIFLRAGRDVILLLACRTNGTGHRNCSKSTVSQMCGKTKWQLLYVKR